MGKHKKARRGSYWKNFFEAVQLELWEHKSTSLVFTVLRLLIILTMIRQFMLQNFEGGVLCILTLLLLFVPFFFQVRFRVELPPTLEVIIMLFIFSADILGEINAFYIKIPFWDTILHTLNGFLAAAVGFSLVVLLNQDSRIMFKLSPAFVSLVAFCFSMTIGVLWEFFEFGMDSFFQLDMQKGTIVHSISSVMLNPAHNNMPVVINNIGKVTVNGSDLGLGGYLDIGLIDTMKDLLVNFVGAVVFSVFGYFYLKKSGKGPVVKRFMPVKKTAATDYLTQIEERKAEKAHQ